MEILCRSEGKAPPKRSMRHLKLPKLPVVSTFSWIMNSRIFLRTMNEIYPDHSRNVKQQRRYFTGKRTSQITAFSQPQNRHLLQDPVITRRKRILLQAYLPILGGLTLQQHI